MSLNKLCLGSQSNPQPSLQPRFASLIVDNKFSASGLNYPLSEPAGSVNYMRSDGSGNLSLQKSNYGSVGYYNNNVTYNVTTIPPQPSSKVVSGNQNISNNSQGITANADGITVISGGAYLLTANISFVSLTANTSFVLSIGVNGSGSNKALFTGSTTEIRELSVTEVRFLNPGDNLQLLFQTTFANADVAINSWTLAVKNLT